MIGPQSHSGLGGKDRNFCLYLESNPGRLVRSLISILAGYYTPSPIYLTVASEGQAQVAIESTCDQPCVYKQGVHLKSTLRHTGMRPAVAWQPRRLYYGLVAFFCHVGLIVLSFRKERFGVDLKNIIYFVYFKITYVWKLRTLKLCKSWNVCTLHRNISSRIFARIYYTKASSFMPHGYMLCSWHSRSFS